MQYTIKNSISTFIQRSSMLAKSVDESDASVDLLKASDELMQASLQVSKLTNCLDDLHNCRASLESVGYSDEWFKIMNRDGHFLEAINLELSDIVGTIQDKQDVCMEGLVDTIKRVIARIWQFISDLLKKVVGFLKSLMPIINVNLRSEKSCNAALDSVKRLIGYKEAPSDTELAKCIGDKIMEMIAKDQITALDRRDILTQMHGDVFVMCACTNLLAESLDIAAIKEGKDITKFFTKDVITFATAKHYGQPSYFNYVINDCILKNPARLQNLAGSGIKPLQFKDFNLLHAVDNMKQYIETCGIVIDENSASIIKDLEATFKSIDYAETYKSTTHYDLINKACEVVVKIDSDLVNVISKRIKALQAMTDNIAKAAALFDGSATEEQLKTGLDGAALSGITTSIMTMCQFIASCALTFNKMHTKLNKFTNLTTAAIKAVEDDIVKELKK